MTMPKGWKPSYANKSPEVLDDRIRKMCDLNHNEIELKKWMVEGIRYEIQAYKEALKSYKEKFDIFSEEWTSNLLNFRNSILAVISSVVIGAVSIAPFITIVNPPYNTNNNYWYIFCFCKLFFSHFLEILWKSRIKPHRYCFSSDN
jgi:hypothetical protein